MVAKQLRAPQCRRAEWGVSSRAGSRRKRHFRRSPVFSGQWIARVHGRRPSRGSVLDMYSSMSPTQGEQQNSVWNGHYACTCYHLLFGFKQFGDLKRWAMRAGNFHSADWWDAAHLHLSRRWLHKSRSL